MTDAAGNAQSADGAARGAGVDDPHARQALARRGVSWIRRDRTAGPRLSILPVLFLLALLFACWSIWIAATEIDDCGGDKSWQMLPPAWECIADA